MKIGISTYAFRWEWTGATNQKKPASLTDLLMKTKKFGAEVFQICDFPVVEQMTLNELTAFKNKADSEGIDLEVGTQGVHPEHLRKYLKIATALGSKVLRTMLHDSQYQPTVQEAEEWLKEVLPDFEQAGVKIALETYEPILSKDLVKIASTINSPFIGICLDPGNSISELEFPDDVISATAPYVTNLHFKDFVFKRREGAIGFNLTGAPVGEGQLNLDFLLNTLKAKNKDVNGIIELWLPFTDSIEKTLELQDEWIQKSVDHLKHKLAIYELVGQ